MSKVIFSICIPTYNRAKELKATLANIVRQKGFDASVEIVIADNASTDKTEGMVKEFRKKYKNIVYSRSETNIGSDRNMVRSAMLASGKYIKLMNDNKCFAAGALEKMKSIFDGADESVVFFKNVGPHSIICTSTVDDFLKDVSIHCTWLAGISFRRDLLHRVGITKKDYPPFMSQTGVMLKLLKKRPSALVVNGSYLIEPIMPFRGGYNFYEVYCEIYVRYLNRLNKDGWISKDTLKKMKREILRFHIFPFTFDAMFGLRNNQLGTDRAVYYMVLNFKEDPFLYLLPLWLLNKMVRFGWKKGIGNS